MPVVEHARTRIHYEVGGAGFPLVLLHGLPLTGASWRLAGYLDGLMRRYRCITVDSRGAGGSDKPHEPTAHALDLYVGDVLAVLENEHLRECAVWGFSWGGAVATALAADRPDRVRCLVLTGAFDIGGRTSEEIDEERPRLEKTRAGGMPAMLADWEPAEDPPLPGWFREMILLYDPRAWLAARYAGWTRPHVRDERITAPTLVIVGSREDPDGEAAHWADGLADGRSVTVPGATHCGTFLAAPASLAAALPFLDQALAGRVGDGGRNSDHHVRGRGGS
jgi:pimeloyl-ACP methyl ester carboxylesterase